MGLAGLLKNAGLSRFALQCRPAEACARMRPWSWGSSHMRLRRSFERPSLRASLFALAVACTIPIALVAGGLVWYFTAKEFDQYERDLSDRAALMLTAIELKVRNIVEDIQILAESPTLAAGDFARF